MIRPIGNRILVLPDPAGDKSPAGLLIPEKFQVKMARGVIIRVGPGEYSSTGDLIPTQVTIGERIVWNEYAGVPIPADQQVSCGGKCVIIGEDDVLAVIEDEE